MDPSDRLLRSVPVVGYAALLVMLGYVVKSGEVAFVRAGLAAFFAGLAIWFFYRFAESIRLEGAPHIESHWGGLGGGVGGWRVSPSLIYLSGAIIFGVLLAFSVRSFDMDAICASKTPGAAPTEGGVKSGAKPATGSSDSKENEIPADRSKPDSKTAAPVGVPGTKPNQESTDDGGKKTTAESKGTSH